MLVFETTVTPISPLEDAYFEHLGFHGWSFGSVHTIETEACSIETMQQI